MRRAYFAIACDTDPDAHPLVRRIHTDAAANWRGITHGIAALRQRLQATAYVRTRGQLPITWLLRADRQIAELYGDPAFCYRAFNDAWAREQEAFGSEIGWHPHLYRWAEQENRWIPYLGIDDDSEVEELDRCLGELRRCVDVACVRTGWCYQSNTIMQFFDRAGISVEASALPGSVEWNGWHHDWNGTSRTPFSPSRSDYRRPATAGTDALPILALPMLVRELTAWHHAGRYVKRVARAAGSATRSWPLWQPARWQGVTITRHRHEIATALRQTLAGSATQDDVFIGTYFHTGELLSTADIETFARNVDTMADIIRTAGLELVPATLTSAGRRLAANIASSCLVRTIK